MPRPWSAWLVQRPATADLEALLRELVTAGVEFIVVGGAAAVIHGAPVTTQDLDVVPRQDGPAMRSFFRCYSRFATATNNYSVANAAVTRTSFMPSGAIVMDSTSYQPLVDPRSIESRRSPVRGS